MNRTVIAVFLALTMVLAGCSTGVSSPSVTGDGLPGDATSTVAEDASEATDGTSDDGSGAVGSVAMYISDERNAIDQFAHLNVTITHVGFKPAASDGNDAPRTTPENATVDTQTIDNGTAETGVDETESGEFETTADAATETGEDGDSERAGWLERDVEVRSVDLTRLQGPNATLLGNLSVPADEYTTIFVSVSEIEGTLQSGEEVTVKLPSQKLHLNRGFTLSEGESVSFVFDLTVFEAGNSGKYILKPVVSESGPDQEIDRVDDDRGASDRDADRDRDRLEARFAGPVEPGENATVVVSQNGSAVVNATVSADDQSVETTNASGLATVSVPAEATEFELEIVTDEAETTLSWEAKTDTGDNEDGAGPPDDPGTATDE
ncbi:DUF4382 domain-containing protein [Halorhabdus salina]|uniref:DUF4382 domain-containing protein n=1 Tax=Halorhabdus salina TaxID=2750670 RepID=UPI0015EEEC96|nr:DUF4382 domain-containing protein [Halorhabdus salina]